jgi:hypothetical protein
MGICWSEPERQTHVGKSEPVATYVQASAPPYNPNYTYAVKPQPQIYYQQQYVQPQQQYVQQQYIQAQYQQQQYPQQYIQYQQYPQQQYPQRNTTGTGTGTVAAVAGGFLLGAITESILDPTD